MKRKAFEIAKSNNSKINVATYAQKVEVPDWYHQNGKNQSKTVIHFSTVYPELKIKQPLLSKWLKSKETIRSKESQSSHSSTKKIQQICHPKVEAALVEWMTQAIHGKMTVTGDIIKAKWRDSARPAGIPTDKWLKLSGGCLDCFKKRHQLKYYQKHGESSSVDPAVVELEAEQIQNITKDYPLKDIFNMDETGVLYL